MGRQRGRPRTSAMLVCGSFHHMNTSASGSTSAPFCGVSLAQVRWTRFSGSCARSASQLLCSISTTYAAFACRARHRIMSPSRSPISATTLPRTAGMRKSTHMSGARSGNTLAALKPGASGHDARPARQGARGSSTSRVAAASPFPSSRASRASMAEKWDESAEIASCACPPAPLKKKQTRTHAHELSPQPSQRYMDGKRGPWKTLLDNWFARSEIGRGALFDARTADCTRAISSSIMNNKSQIASFHT